MSMLDRLPVTNTDLDAPPPEAGLSFDPGPGDWMMLEAGHLPDESFARIGATAIKPIMHEPTILEVWPPTRSE